MLTVLETLERTRRNLEEIDQKVKEITKHEVVLLGRILENQCRLQNK